ncbi:MAG: hypothetical protein GX663_05220 [Clostridiales bacterium]|nr:hypothetical protein [Clostridiales bacterium]
MSFRNNGRRRDARKLMCALAFLVFTIIFLGSMKITGFSTSKLIFGLICAYLCSAFYRTSNE